MSPRTSACGPNRADPPTTTTSPFTSPLMFALPPMTTTSPRTYSSLSTETLPPMRTMSSRRRARGVRGTSGSMRSVEPGSSVGAVGSAGFAGGVLPTASDRRAVESRYESCSTISVSAGPRRSLNSRPVTGAPSIAIVESESSMDLIDVLNRGVSTMPFAIGTISNRASSLVRSSSTLLCADAAITASISSVAAAMKVLAILVPLFSISTTGAAPRATARPRRPSAPGRSFLPP